MADFLTSPMILFAWLLIYVILGLIAVWQVHTPAQPLRWTPLRFFLIAGSLHLAALVISQSAARGLSPRFTSSSDWIGFAIIAAILALPAVVAPLASAAYWRRRWPIGHCNICGYDLCANKSGRCPECGTIDYAEAPDSP